MKSPEEDISPDDVMYYAHGRGIVTMEEFFEWYNGKDKSWSRLNEFIKSHKEITARFHFHLNQKR